MGKLKKKVSIVPALIGGVSKAVLEDISTLKLKVSFFAIIYDETSMYGVFTYIYPPKLPLNAGKDIPYFWCVWVS